MSFLKGHWSVVKSREFLTRNSRPLMQVHDLCWRIAQMFTVVVSNMFLHLPVKGPKNLTSAYASTIAGKGAVMLGTNSTKKQPRGYQKKIEYVKTRGCRFVPVHVRKQSATDGTNRDLNIGEFPTVWRLHLRAKSTIPEKQPIRSWKNYFFGPASSTCTFQLHGSKLAWSPQEVCNILLPSDIRCDLRLHLNLGGGFKYFLCSTLLGEMIQCGYYFSKGLKPSTSNEYDLTSFPPKNHPENGEEYPSKVGRYTSYKWGYIKFLSVGILFSQLHPGNLHSP